MVTPALAGRSPDVVVIGAGPVGLAMALMLAAQGRDVVVTEARDELVLSDANSYPIGVNPRGLEALRRIDPALVERLRAESEVIAAWRIHVGRRVVAQLDSGTVLSTTRATLTRLLWERAQAEPRITLALGHRLTGLDVAARSLHYEAEGEKATVDASGARVVVADGVWSAARRSLAEQVPGFEPRVEEWGLRFRVLFSQPGASAPGLDPTMHHIFTDRGLYTATLRDGTWCVSTTAVAGSPEEQLLLADEATADNVRRLREFVRTHARLAAPLLTEQDYVDFFSREAFSGAVVQVPSLHLGEWLVLLGDAAHAVIPPTGEGVNAGLEDCTVLAEHLASGSATPFADFSAARLPDVAALGEYARGLLENLRTDDAAYRGATLVLRIVNAVGGKVGLRAGQVEERLFGARATGEPYREILGPWLRQRERWFGPVHGALRLVGRLRAGRR